MIVFSNMYTTLQFEKGYACTHISILHYFNVDPLTLSSHLYSESHSYNYCGLVCIHGDDKVESGYNKAVRYPASLVPRLISSSSASLGTRLLSNQVKLYKYHMICDSIHGKIKLYPAAGIQT